MITRQLKTTIKKHQKHGFINIIYGPRRVGKTTLLQQLTQNKQGQTLWFNGDTQETQDYLSNTSEVHLSNLVKNHNIIVVDEAQRIRNIGLSLKILIDKFPKKTYYVSGSSSITLSQGLQESLTGRNQTYKLFPLSNQELTIGFPPHQQSSLLKDQLIYGSYPYLTNLQTSKDKQDYLQNIINDYLFKDILLLKNIEQPHNLQKLVTLLAFQLGSKVSYNELANNLQVDVKTIIRYLSLLKQSFIIFELSSFSRNLRKEVAKAKKYYFWDLGLRNAIIGQFHSPDIRPDIGGIWENFLAIERLKKQEYKKQTVKHYFWQTYDQAEIDWVEEFKGKISAFEFKWGKKQAKTPKDFKHQYHVNLQTVNQNNYLKFISSS